MKLVLIIVMMLIVGGCVNASNHEGVEVRDIVNTHGAESLSADDITKLHDAVVSTELISLVQQYKATGNEEYKKLAMDLLAEQCPCVALEQGTVIELSRVVTSLVEENISVNEYSK